jgi:recombination protein RecA
MSQALRKLTAVVSSTKCTVVFINQLREKVGIVWGNPEVTTGGRALKFYSSVRIDIRRKEILKNGGNIIGNRAHVKVTKNKVAPPFRETEFDIIYGKGVSLTGELVDLASEHGIIKKSGAWYSYNDIKIGQGRDAAKQYLAENPDVMNGIEKQIREIYELPACEEEKEPQTAENEA